MAKEVYYKQTSLTKKNEDGLSTTSQVTWIPEKYAKLNEFVKLKGEDDIWVDGWKVECVGRTRLSEKQLPDYRKMIRGHRMKTGDSMKKEK